MPATLTRAEYLKRDELQTVAADAALKARWGDDGERSTQSTTLAAEADATAEAARQLAFLGVPRAIDTAVVTGLWPDLEGKTVRLPYDAFPLGITGNVDMLVTGAKLDRATGKTTLTGLMAL